jgi:hypothetical protein
MIFYSICRCKEALHVLHEGYIASRLQDLDWTQDQKNTYAGVDESIAVGLAA